MIIKLKVSKKFNYQHNLVLFLLKDAEETRTLHTKRHNVEIMMGCKTGKILEQLFRSLLQNYQKDLEESMRGSEFNFVDLLLYHHQKISLKRGGSYIDSREWLKNKKATINPQNNHKDCFQYALTVALNHKQIKSHPERISKIKPFINQYDWKEIEFLTHSKDWRKFESNNKTIALNILFPLYNTEKIRFAYKSKHNFKRENQVILLMITDGKKWNYLPVKSLPALLRGITSNHDGDFYCLNGFHLYRTEKNSENMKEYVMIMIIVM